MSTVPEKRSIGKARIERIQLEGGKEVFLRIYRDCLDSFVEFISSMEEDAVPIPIPEGFEADVTDGNGIWLMENGCGYMYNKYFYMSFGKKRLMTISPSREIIVTIYQ